MYQCYAYNGNQLIDVKDDGDDFIGFADGSSYDATDPDYEYDANGNLISDVNKGITNIIYNHLNLPEVITLTGGTITFLYDANGNKLRKTVSGSSQDYLGGIEYSGGAIDAIYHEEGRATPTLTGWQYEYYLKDHLGNTRVIFTEDGPDADSEPDILQEVDYYPFGMTHNSPTATNHYLFNGIERQDDLNLNVDMAHFRTYDYAIGRWWQTDPRYDVSVSSYVGFGNNPTLLTDPLGDTTRVYSLDGIHRWTIPDNLPNQEHFIGSLTVGQQRAVSNASNPDVEGSLIRKYSKFYVGKNTRRDLAIQANKAEGEGAESPGLLYYNISSKELRLFDLAAYVDIAYSGKLSEAYIDECGSSYRCGDRVNITPGLASELFDIVKTYGTIVGESHTHGLYSIIAFNTLRANPSQQISLSKHGLIYSGRPSNADLATNQLEKTGGFQLGFLGTEFGYTIYSSGMNYDRMGSKNQYNNNGGQIYDYSGRLHKSFQTQTVE